MYNCNLTTNSCPNITLTMSANQTRLAPCDLITYTVTINNEDSNVTYGVFKENLPCPLVFLPGTVTINGAKASDSEYKYDSSTNTLTVNLPTMTGPSTSVVTFQVTKNS